MGEGTIVFAGPNYDLGTEERATLLAEAGATREGFTGMRSRAVRGLNWGPLPGAAAEAEDIDAALGASAYGPVVRYEGDGALEEVFKAITAPRILHVGTHGFFLEDQKLDEDERFASTGELESGFGAAKGLARLRGTENPLMRSGLVFAGANTLGAANSDASVEDGWVTAEEIAMMDLRSTELVVLSACESGLGEVKTGDGVHGLRRAFAYAGVHALLTSLFKVPDTETRALMQGFYDGLKAGNGKLTALRDAQLALIEARRAANDAAHPFFWASFILIGETG